MSDTLISLLVIFLVSFYSCFRNELTNTSAALFYVAGSDWYRHQTAHNTGQTSAFTTSAARERTELSELLTSRPVRDQNISMFSKYHRFTPLL